MISNFFENLINNSNLFDVFIIIIFIYNVVQCFVKGFSLSLFSFMKWILSTIVTIIMVPKLQPLIGEYVQSDFINNVGLGIAIFIFTLFITILIGKTLYLTFNSSKRILPKLASATDSKIPLLQIFSP